MDPSRKKTTAVSGAPARIAPTSSTVGGARRAPARDDARSAAHAPAAASASEASPGADAAAWTWAETRGAREGDGGATVASARSNPHARPAAGPACPRVCLTS